MTMLAEKLQKAGADTIGAQLTTALAEGVRRHPESVVDAWRHAGTLFGYELTRKLMGDMQVPIKPYTPRVIPKERIEERRKLQEIVRSKYKNSSGVHWSDVGWHELHGFARDGGEAAALLDAGPANPPNTSATVGEVLGIARVNSIIEAVRR